MKQVIYFLSETESRERKVLLILFAVILCISFWGCHASNTTSIEDIYTLDLPQGCTLSGENERTCSIIDNDGVIVGGVILTDLDVDDLRDSDSMTLVRYLNETAEGSEFLSWKGDGQLIRYVDQQYVDPDTQEEKRCFRGFVERNSAVYDIWFNIDQINYETVQEYFSIFETK